MAVVMLSYALLGLALLVRDEVIQPKDAARWKLPYLVSTIPVSVWVTIAVIVTLAVMFEGAFRLTRSGVEQHDAQIKELRNRIAILEAVDVRLEGMFPESFALHAYGHACEIQVGPITIEATRIGTDEGHPLIYPRQTLEFPIVSGLRDSVLPIEPTLLSWEGYGRKSSTWHKPGTAEAMKQFLHALWLVRRYRAAQSVLRHDDIDFRGNQFNDAELELFTERMQQPSEIAFDITYWNSERTLNWKRTEQLVFEPQTDTAFVRHFGHPVPIGRSEAVS